MSTPWAEVLVGHTGFVGSNLRRQMAFDLCIHRENLDALRGIRADRLVLSCLPAEKWRINAAPQDDLDNLHCMQDVLSTVQARQIVLISTADVFLQPLEVDEDSAPQSTSLHPYGKHRLAFEDWVRQRFERCCILRLPGVFGPGLKKNILFDLHQEHRIEHIHPDGVFQWYPIARLWADIERALALELTLVHVAPAPWRTRDLVARLWPKLRLTPNVSAAPQYRVRSRHAERFGGDAGFWMSPDQVIDALHDWRNSAAAVAR
jgi:hypothetical protein